MNREDTHILIIDDNEDILVMLKAMLQFKDYKVTIKDNAHQIENFIQQANPDVILMDMLLSGANGTEICKQIKENPAIASIPVVMISAMPQAEKKCLDAGADYFVGKPFEMDNMLDTVEMAVNGITE